MVSEYIAERPAADQDEAHQHNWIRKAEIATREMAAGEVYCDRDFLTSLGFAYSTADRGLLSRRTAWALEHLANGRLVVGDAYLVLDVTPGLSLERRFGTLCCEHPWSRPHVLERLRRFYLSPLDALRRIDGHLAMAFASARWRFIRGEAMTPAEVAALAENLAEEVMRSRS